MSSARSRSRPREVTGHAHNRIDGIFNPIEVQWLTPDGATSL